MFVTALINIFSLIPLSGASHDDDHVVQQAVKAMPTKRGAQGWFASWKDKFPASVHN